MSRWSAAIPLHYPFLDDGVIETCLAVRLHERTSPFEVKPLTIAAMRGIVPAELLVWRTKGEFSADVHVGLAANRAEVAELLDDPILGRMGIIDVAALRRDALGLYPPRLSLAALEATLAVETWLRAAHPGPAIATSPARSMEKT